MKTKKGMQNKIIKIKKKINDFIIDGFIFKIEYYNKNNETDIFYERIIYII